MAKKIRTVKLTGPHGAEVNLTFDGFNADLQRAQLWLDSQIMTDMLPYMPMDTGALIENTVIRSRSLAGTGVVCAAAPPYGRYLYEGKAMVDSQTGKGPRRIVLPAGEVIYRFRKGATLTPTDRDLTFQRPGAEAHWFEAAKRDHFDEWVAGVRKILGGGTNG